MVVVDGKERFSNGDGEGEGDGMTEVVLYGTWKMVRNCCMPDDAGGPGLL